MAEAMMQAGGGNLNGCELYKNTSEGITQKYTLTEDYKAVLCLSYAWNIQYPELTWNGGGDTVVNGYYGNNNTMARTHVMLKINVPKGAVISTTKNTLFVWGVK